MWDTDLADHEMFNTEEHRLFRQTVRRFVQERLVPRAREFDALGRIDKALYAEMGAIGMLGIRYDPAFGGLGLDWTYSAIMAEELACDCKTIDNALQRVKRKILAHQSTRAVLA